MVGHSLFFQALLRRYLAPEYQQASAALGPAARSWLTVRRSFLVEGAWLVFSKPLE